MQSDRQPIVLRMLAVGIFLLCAGCGAARKPEIERRIAGITEANLRSHVEALTALGPRDGLDPAVSAKAADYLAGQLALLGYTPTRERFTATVKDATGAILGKAEAENILAELAGQGTPDVIVEIGAHYDTVKAGPGADDNASAVAGVLEAARAFAGAKPEKTVRFCLFAMEEHGFVGARVHAAGIRKDPKRRVEGMLNLEMIGYASSEPGSQRTPVRIPFLVWPPRTGDFIAVVGNFPSGGIGNRFERAADAYVPDLKVYSLNRLGGFLKDAARSDHSAYWDAGLKAVMITDTANFRNPNYHKATDTIDTLDFAFMRRVAQAAAATLMDWARTRE